MKCPFLREDRVKYCQASAFRKMILERAVDAGQERCSSRDYLQCPAAARRLTGAPADDRCPFLQNALMQYCLAAPVTKYVPANDAALTRCNSDGHLYCEHYLAQAEPQRGRLPAKGGGGRPSRIGDCMVVVDGVSVPEHLFYGPNHMWLDVAEDGNCHIGIDGFLAKVIGTASGVSFASPKGTERPLAVLTAGGVDLQMVFPNPLQDVTPNAYLRTNLAKLTGDPYGAGWLFEGVEPTLPGAPVGAATRAGLIAGDKAARWIDGETDRLARFVHERIAVPDAEGVRLMADGGRVVGGVVALLSRDDVVNLFNEFFSPRLAWQGPW